MKKFALALFLALCLPAASLALPLTSADIAKMVQDCPTLEEYRGAEPAVIWSRKQLYTQDPQGRAVKSTSYVILCGATARLGWLQDQLVAPNGGHIELEQAAIFDPGTAKLLHDLSYDRDELAEHGRLIVNFPKMDDVYVLVLSYRQVFAEPNVMEDIAWLGSEYPTWEGSVQIRIAKEQALDWESSTNAIPTIDVDETFRRYGWFYFKQPANRGMRGMLESSDPYVVFSLATGPATAVAMMHDLEERRWPDLPAKYVVGEGSSRDDVLKSIEKFWRSADRLPGRGTWRSARMIPAGGPWTTWESMYLLASWLQKQGWKAEVWFQHVLPQDRESISCAPALTHPVFLLGEPGAKKSWYYVPGQPGEPGKLPVSLRGKTLYAAGAKKLRRHSVGGTRLEKNRLSIAWDLDVDADCIVSGTVDIRVRNSWVETCESLANGRKDQIYSLFPGLEGWIDLDQDLDISPLGSQGFKLVLPVRARSGIEGQQGLMIGLPSIVPGPMMRLLDVGSSAVLKYPFVVEQSYRVQLPKGYRSLGVPLKMEQGSMVSSYTSQYRINQRKNQLEGEEKLIQSSMRVDVPYLDGFKRVIETWGTWKNTSLALMPAGRPK